MGQSQLVDPQVTFGGMNSARCPTFRATFLTSREVRSVSRRSLPTRGAARKRLGERCGTTTVKTAGPRDAVKRPERRPPSRGGIATAELNLPKKLAAIGNRAQASWVCRGLAKVVAVLRLPPRWCPPVPGFSSVLPQEAELSVFTTARRATCPGQQDPPDINN
ncbi:unnamed protein product [Lampetra fluviatilis]